ncbi:bifunctional diguanylate cyclase/phosphodiesterase [Pseudoalteromonas sp. G4]|uniref:bifunctional diguanylate cyclase/phosphodiesterase n=1 Tax=Pseudoalteromonas sp. G4 TaxID=2992761 RepID=UPI00237E4316|nr:EAL domain-containing protein [Pseudoalteromonas sp. G4]MDE3270643.1 EAL domain-containing protein [Pseudoalteromonas sp. G4]
MQSLINKGMSLKVQIYGLLLFLAAVSFFGRLYLSVENTKEYFQEQMSSHAQDAATSLGLSISPYMDEENIVIAETMMAAIFDSGYYKSMRLLSPEGEVLLERNNPSAIEGVPYWFIDWIDLKAPTQMSEVSSGWQIAGTLYVTSHPGISYLKIWQYSKRAAYGSLLIILFCLFIAYLILKAIFKPLNSLEKQANAVSQKRFEQNEKVPFTTELRVVTTAMNKMVANLRKNFDAMTKQNEKLTKEVLLDELTGLGNRRAFSSYFAANTTQMALNEVHSMCMITLPSLQKLNTELGYQAGDEYVSEVAEILIEKTKQFENSKTFRIAGGSLAIVFDYDKAFLNGFISELNHIFNHKNSNRYEAGYAIVSITEFSHKDELKVVLSNLDTSSTLIQQGVKGADSVDTSFGLNEWRTLINNIISSGEINFSFQPVKLNGKNDLGLYYEVFARFIHNDEQVNNGQLFAMAERLNLTMELDKKLIRSFIELKETHYDKTFALNLSREAFYSAEFLNWLKMYSQVKASLKHNIIFEIKESVLLDDVKAAANVIAEFKLIGIDTCIEHFGTSLTSFKYLQGLDVEFIKIDGSYTQDLLINRQNNFFIQTINNICHSLGIKVIACLIENKETLSLVEELGCDGAQGNYIQEPLNISQKTEENVFTFHTKGLEL